jgi:hypothetical protein
MSNRERWIVYPLVFLTLGIVLRDKFVPQGHSAALQFEAGEIAAQSIRCEQLLVKEVVCDKLDSNQAKCRAFFIHGPGDRPVVVAGSDAKTGAGVIETHTAKCRTFIIDGPGNRPVVTAGSDVKTGIGVIDTYSANGFPLVRIGSSATGGRLFTFELEKAPPPPKVPEKVKPGK